MYAHTHTFHYHALSLSRYSCFNQAWSGIYLIVDVVRGCFGLGHFTYCSFLIFPSSTPIFPQIDKDIEFEQLVCWCVELLLIVGLVLFLLFLIRPLPFVMLF